MNLIEQLVFSFAGGILLIIFGTLKLRDVIKNTEKHTDSALQPYTSGIVFSGGLILFGIVILINKLIGNY